MAYGFGATVVNKGDKETYGTAVDRLLSAIQGDEERKRLVKAQQAAAAADQREQRVRGVLEDLQKVPAYKIQDYIAQLPPDLQEDIRNHGRGLIAPPMSSDDYAEQARLRDFTEAAKIDPTDPRERVAAEARRYRSMFKADLPKEQWSSAMTNNLQGTPGLLEADRIANKQQVTADEAADNSRADRELNEVKLPESRATIGYTNAGTRERNATTTLRGAETALATAKAGAMKNSGIDPDTGLNPSGASGEAYLQSLPKPTADFLRSILDLRADPAKFSSLRTGERQNLAKMVLAADPTFDFDTYSARHKLRQQLMSTNSPRLTINTTIHHLDELNKAIEDLGNRQLPAWNAVANAASVQAGQANVRKFQVAANAVASETAKVFKGTASPTEGEIEHWLTTVNANDSPEQQQAAAKQVVKLLAGRLEALSTMMEQARLPKDLRVLDGKSRSVLQKMGFDPDEFEKAAGRNFDGPASTGQTFKYTAKNAQGVRIGSNDGVTWQPIQ